MRGVVAGIVKSFMFPMPRLICICDQFKPGKQDPDFAWCKCANCNGWMSDYRLAGMADRGERK